MKHKITRQQVRKLLNKKIYAYKKDGTVVSGKLVRISGNNLFVQSRSTGKAHTKAIVPLVLFDLLAIGTSPYGYGYPGFGYQGFGYPGIGGYPGYGYPGYPYYF